MWIARFLLLLPLWWSANPWHVTGHHPGPQDDGHDTQLEGSHVVGHSQDALEDVNLFDMDTGDTDHAFDCSVGPCVAIVANALAVKPSKVSRTFTSTRHNALDFPASPPPTPPPIHS